MKPQTIALDGSAASGKSTLGIELARRLNYLYLDTGVMYRAVTWAALNANIAVTDETAVGDLCEQIDLQILPATVNDGRQVTVLVNSVDVSRLIHKQNVNHSVSQVSSYAKVRQILTQRQRAIAESGPVVMAGRDIGTVVLPNADLKLFITASVEVRARRRYEECLRRKEAVTFDEVLASMTRRDKLDAEKPISPMVPAEDAIIINTDHLSQGAVLQKVESLIYQQAAA